ncbi:MAG: endonuclease/exonuclease/phosphatase family protein [Woeseiaceae bacterium]
MFRKGLTLTFVTAALLLATSTAAQADDWRSFRAGQLRVVTQNLYVGGDILLPLSVPPQQFPAAAAEVIGQILATNYPERAIELAELLRHDWPHLVGLQEVYIVKICLDETQLVCLLDQDYLEILLDNLNHRFSWYREVATVTNIDLQNLPATLPDGTSVYVSITDRDVILAHRFVRTDNAIAENYQAVLPVDNPLLPPGFAVLRGYTMVDAVVWGREYRFVNTHLEVKGEGSDLEPFFRAVQAGQALELVSTLQSDTHVQVVVGDFNSDPLDGPIVDCLLPDGMGGFVPGICPTPYAVMAGAIVPGVVYTDVWLERRGPFDFGYTCCQATVLDNAISQLDERVDLIWARQATDYVGPPFLRSVRANVIGEEPRDKTFPSGLWPSDHAGVSAKMILFAPK